MSLLYMLLSGLLMRVHSVYVHFVTLLLWCTFVESFSYFRYKKKNTRGRRLSEDGKTYCTSRLAHESPPSSDEKPSRWFGLVGIMAHRFAADSCSELVPDRSMLIAVVGRGCLVQRCHV